MDGTRIEFGAGIRGIRSNCTQFAIVLNKINIAVQFARMFHIRSIHYVPWRLQYIYIYICSVADLLFNFSFKCKQAFVIFLFSTLLFPLRYAHYRSVFQHFNDVMKTNAYYRHSFANIGHVQFLRLTSCYQSNRLTYFSQCVCVYSYFCVSFNEPPPTLQGAPRGFSEVFANKKTK